MSKKSKNSCLTPKVKLEVSKVWNRLIGNAFEINRSANSGGQILAFFIPGSARSSGKISIYSQNSQKLGHIYGD